jgi:hypothetical protein
MMVRLSRSLPSISLFLEPLSLPPSRVSLRVSLLESISSPSIP